ncbi:hypothetical protein [Nocardia arizonensis]|nr:hypothetical protein [Nocardia arizonensis]
MTEIPDVAPLPRTPSGPARVRGEYELPSSLELFGFGIEDEPPSPA